jgi:hypothetical protein
MQEPEEESKDGFRSNNNRIAEMRDVAAEDLDREEDPELAIFNIARPPSLTGE